MKGLVQKVDTFSSQKVYFQDIDSLYIHMGNSEKLKEDGYVGNNLRQRKNHYGDDVGTFFGFFLASNLKFPFTVEKKSTSGNKMTFKDFIIQKFSGNWISWVFL